MDINFNNIDFPPVLFISGIDTDAGKTFATGWLAFQMMKLGLEVTTQKFIQTGNKDMSEDIVAHRKIMGVPLSGADRTGITAPIILSYPASPDLAARIDNTEINTDVIAEATKALTTHYSHVLLEGAGGLMVPIKAEYLTIDYIADHELPVILVTNGRLGSINHTLLSLSALKAKGISLFAVVYNTYFDQDKVIAEDTRSYIRKWTEHHFPKAYYWEF